MVYKQLKRNNNKSNALETLLNRVQTNKIEHLNFTCEQEQEQEQETAIK